VYWGGPRRGSGVDPAKAVRRIVAAGGRLKAAGGATSEATLLIYNRYALTRVGGHRIRSRHTNAPTAGLLGNDWHHRR
jgi:hypothetical protein